MSDFETLTIDEFASLLDVSLLKPDVAPADIDRLCELGQEYGFNICFNSVYTSRVVQNVGKQFPLALAACVSFPFGVATTSAKVREAAESVENGATEIDMVLGVGLLKGGYEYYDLVERDIAEVVKASGPAGVKVIFENCYLTDNEKITACKLATNAGAAFVKTSTGYGTGGATLDDVRLMRANTPAHIKVKAAGGIRTYSACIDFLKAGSDRIGIGLNSAIPILESIKK
ncbi:MAG: deoxyribose-phosphate aldolase [Anaerolineaceae bacterium]|jgi:deoxyribose-phosphate aldolase